MRSRIVGPDGNKIDPTPENRRGNNGGSKSNVAVLSAIAGIIFGGGGVFGIVKWLDSREIESLRAQYQVAQAQAKLAESYRDQRDELESQLSEIANNDNPGRSLRLQSELNVVNENLTFLLNRQDFPGWARERVRQAQSAAGNIVP